MGRLDDIFAIAFRVTSLVGRSVRYLGEPVRSISSGVFIPALPERRASSGGGVRCADRFAATRS